MDTPAPPPTAASLGPDHRDLYLIVAGVLIGILLGPGVLGRLSPDAYHRMFVGGMTAEEQRGVLEREFKDLGPAPTAVSELRQDVLQKQANLAMLRQGIEEAQRERTLSLVGLMAGLVLAALAIMAVETLVEPTNLATRSRLATARYAVMAMWLALLLAKPAMLKLLSPPFVALALIVALVAALMPMGRKRA